VAHRNTLKILDLGWKGIGPPLTLTSYLATRCTQQPYRWAQVQWLQSLSAQGRE